MSLYRVTGDRRILGVCGPDDDPLTVDANGRHRKFAEPGETVDLSHMTAPQLAPLVKFGLVAPIEPPKPAGAATKKATGKSATVEED